jgi:aminopeptidase N
MSNWIDTTGYPVVESKLKGSTLFISQKRFVFGNGDRGSKWLIPIRIKTANGRIVTDLFDKRDKAIRLGTRPAWYKINYGQSGFYRVNYLDDNLTKLGELVSNRKLGTLDRLGVNEDLFGSVINGTYPLDRYLDSISYYKNEDNYLILGDIHSNLDTLEYMYIHEEFWPHSWQKLKEFFNGPYRRLLNKLGWEPRKNESQSDAFSRSIAIGHLTFTEQPDVIENGMRLFERYRKDIRSIHPNIKRSILRIAAKNGNKKTFDQILKLYLETDSIEDKLILLGALTQFKDPRLVARVLALSLTDKVRAQELPSVIGSVAGNPYARRLLLPWYKRNWLRLKRYEDDASVFKHIMKALILSRIGSKEESEARRFFRTRPVRYKMVLKQYFELLKRRNNWVGKNKEAFKDYF